MHDAVDKSKQGMVTAYADVVAGKDFCTALTHYDRARSYDLPACAFSPKPLGI